ncbi:MAG: PEP-utilizing enzyme, partial [Alphaproteobacteria bacterium]
MTATGERQLSGTAAASGLARGTLHPFHDRRPAFRSGGAEADRAALARAIARAADALTELMSGTDSDEAAGMLAFQVAMLEDETLSDPAYAAIEAGQPADEAWFDTLGALIADFADSDDPTFAARSADLIDLRDRVLDALCGRAGGLGTLPPGAILVAEDVTPSRFLEVDWSHAAGMALAAGSRASHVAILARGRGVPMLVGLGKAAGELPAGAPAWLDADRGLLVV